jgi:hypothetical protein
MIHQHVMRFITEKIVSEDEARAILAPLRPDLRRVWENSVRDWLLLPEDSRARLMQTPFVPPVVIFGFSQSYATELFTGREGIEVCDALGVFAFYVHHKVLLRFNSIDRDHVVRNADKGTNRKNQYFRHEPVFGIDNSVTRLTVGYRLDVAKASLATVVISCQIGDTCHYSFDIDDEKMGVKPMPTPDTAPEPQPFDGKTQAKRRPR